MKIEEYSVFSDFYVNERKDHLLNAIISKWSNKYDIDIYEDQRDNSKSIIALICQHPSKIEVLGHVDLFLNEHDVLVVPDTFNVKSDTEEFFALKWFFYSDKVLSEEEQNMNKYIVYATLSDQYALKVRANSEEEAYKKAYETHISNWEHLITKPELKESVRVPDPECSDAQRWSKWGDFSINLENS